MDRKTEIDEGGEARLGNDPVHTSIEREPGQEAISSIGSQIKLCRIFKRRNSRSPAGKHVESSCQVRTLHRAQNVSERTQRKMLYHNPIKSGRRASSRMQKLRSSWGAKHVMASSNDQIHAIVEEGRFRDAKVVDYISKTLESRRDAIGRAWFKQVLPLEGFRIADDRLAFDDLAVQYHFSSPGQYQFSWFVWHNETRQKEDVSGSQSSAPPDSLRSLAAGSYIGCRIALAPADKRTVTVYFHHDGDIWKLIGISRTTASTIRIRKTREETLVNKRDGTSKSATTWRDHCCFVYVSNHCTIRWIASIRFSLFSNPWPSSGK
jgi:hypothetical protein